MEEITLGVVFFSTIVLILVLLVLAARRLLVPSGECMVTINQGDPVSAQVGQRLQEVLLTAGVDLPAACGGTGTCGLCKVRVPTGGGAAGQQELAHLSRIEAHNACRLACQVPVLTDMSVEVDEVYFGVETWLCTVKSTQNVATLIREIVLDLPAGQEMKFEAGAFVQITCPASHIRFSEFDIDKEYRDVWNKLNLWRLQVSTDKAVTRAYSMANHPAEAGRILLNIRIALPPPGRPDIPPGVMSSWLFSLKAGDKVSVMGPYGNFVAQDSEREALFIGGGAGMAPLRAQIFDLLESRDSKRKISFWYGARSKRELFYADDFERLAKDYSNFDWHVALSEPDPEDKWSGSTGFIHRVLLDNYLATHPAPEDCEYYLCGPPLMVKAVLATLDDLGVEMKDIYYDDFGG